MYQILDIINNRSRINVWYISNVEPDPAVVLEMHPTVSLAHAMWAQECTSGTAEHWLTMSEGRILYLQAKKPPISTSPMLTSHLSRSCTDWCICTAAHHNAVAVPLSCGENMPGFYCWGWWKFDCKTTLQKISLNNNPPPQILSSQPASSPCVPTQIFLKGCAVPKEKNFSIRIWNVYSKNKQFLPLPDLSCCI